MFCQELFLGTMTFVQINVILKLGGAHFGTLCVARLKYQDPAQKARAASTAWNSSSSSR